MGHKGGNDMVSDSDIVTLEIGDGLRYLKHVEVTRLKPQHFDLDCWKPSFIIPNSWMKKIYRDEVYRDSDIEEEDTTEKLTPYQKKVLNDYLTLQRKLHVDKSTSLARFRKKEPPPIENISEILERRNDGITIESDEISDIEDPANERVKQNKPLISSNCHNIAICRGHRVQPELDIVEKAINAMNNVSPDIEKKYQELLKDEKFMQDLLNRAKTCAIQDSRAEKSNQRAAD